MGEYKAAFIEGRNVILKISLAMIVKNAEKTIKRCIESVNDLVDEIVIVDTGSTDHTLNELKNYPNIKIYNFNWEDDFSSARNYSIERTTGDYILVLDADEYIVDGTKEELIKVINKTCIGRIEIKSFYKKENQEYTSQAYISRLFPKTVRYTGIIHEQLNTKLPRVNINVKVNHSGYLAANKGKRNIPLLLKEIKRNPNDCYYLFQLGKELRITGQFKESLYFLMQAYKLAAVELSFYKELVVELIYSGKEVSNEGILQIIKENEEFLKNVADFHFAKGLFFLDYSISNPSIANNYFEKIETSFLRCLELKEVKHFEFVSGTSSYLATFNLGLFYELTGNKEKALDYYLLSHNKGYSKAKERLKLLTHNYF